MILVVLELETLPARKTKIPFILSHSSCVGGPSHPKNINCDIFLHVVCLVIRMEFIRTTDWIIGFSCI